MLGDIHGSRSGSKQVVKGRRGASANCPSSTSTVRTPEEGQPVPQRRFPPWPVKEFGFNHRNERRHNGLIDNDKAFLGWFGVNDLLLDCCRDSF